MSPSEGWRKRVAAALDAGPVAWAEFASGAEVLQALRQHAPQIVIADGYVGDMSGLAFIRETRELNGGEQVRIVVVQRCASEMDRILAFENGADDFVEDPFFPRELLSRVQALLRRAGRTASAERPIPPGNEVQIEVDRRDASVELAGVRLNLTARELEILQILIRHEGKVVRRNDLIRELRVGRAVNQRVVDTHVKSIRRKLGSARRIIATVHGVGYRFDGDAARAPAPTR